MTSQDEEVALFRLMLRQAISKGKQAGDQKKGKKKKRKHKKTTHPQTWEGGKDEMEKVGHFSSLQTKTKPKKKAEHKCVSHG